MVQLTEKAIGKVKDIMSSQSPAPGGLRIAVVGGGCSGFSYSMAFENQPNMLDKTYEFGGLKVYIDQASMLYLDGAEVDYVETLEGAGFKFVAKSEVNANPKDTKDYPKGVWTLPPTLRLGDVDREKYLRIGESDRMTLKFIKP